MGAALGEQVLLIKYGPGGQSLRIIFRPPIAGPVEGVKPEDLGGQCRVLVKIVHESLKKLKKNFSDFDEKQFMKSTVSFGFKAITISSTMLAATSTAQTSCI